MSPSRSARTGLKAAVAAAGAVGLLSTGVAFAASGHPPWSGAHAAADASTHAADHTQPTHPAHPTHPTGGASEDAHSTGPDSHALGGLCRAYVSGNKTEHGQALASPAFTALVMAAGGADNVAAFCSTVPHGPTGAHPTQPTHPAKPTQAASPTRPAHPTHPTEAPSSTHPAQPSHPTQTGHTHPAQPSQRVMPTQRVTPTRP